MGPSSLGKCLACRSGLSHCHGKGGLGDGSGCCCVCGDASMHSDCCDCPACEEADGPEVTEEDES